MTDAERTNNPTENGQKIRGVHRRGNGNGPTHVARSLNWLLVRSYTEILFLTNKFDKNPSAQQVRVLPRK